MTNRHRLCQTALVVHVQFFETGTLLPQGDYEKMVQNVDVNNLLRDIDEAHCPMLAESFHKYRF